MSRRVLIIGLDGATFDVINPLMEKGLMPCLKRLMEGGASGPLTSTVPPISGPAWLSLATGMRPEKTGVYDFVYRKDNSSYRLGALSSADYAGRAIWDYLGDAGKRVGIFNYLMCIPPYEVNGFLSAGLGILSDGKYTFPADLKDEFDKASGGQYEFSVPYHDPKYDDTVLFLKDLNRVFQKNVKVTKYLLKEKDWDFFWAVFSETDWLQHIMWRHIDRDHPLHEGEKSVKLQKGFKEFWKLIDKAIEEFIGIAGSDTNIIIHSDHGFGTNDEIFRLNSWLEQEGYLFWRKGQNTTSFKSKRFIASFCKAIARGIKLDKMFPGLYHLGKAAKEKFVGEVIDQIDLDKSVAFDPGHTMPFGGIYINDKLINTVTRRLELVKEIKQKLSEWGKQNDVKIDFWQMDSLSGDELNTQPDLIIGIDNWRCVMPKYFSKEKIFERRSFSSRHTGSHRMNGMFIAVGPDIKNCRVDNINICDFAPMLFYLFDQPIPSNLDGKVLEDIFSTEYLDKYPLRIQGKNFDQETISHLAGNKTFTRSEEQQIRKQLRDLGYL